MITENSVNLSDNTTVVQAGSITGGLHMHGAPARRSIAQNLPPITPRFTGRVSELDELTRRTGSRFGGRVCAVDGAPGIGKTTFAVRWAETARSLFPDGQVYLNLRGFDPLRPPMRPESAIRVLLDALHVPPRDVPPDPDGQLVLFRSLVADRSLLFIIDNARDSEQVRPLLPSSPGSFAVVTSRHRLDGLHLHHGAERIALAPLTDADATLLVERHLGLLRAEVERAAVARVVAACGGHPLALSVVAVRAAECSLAAVADELADRHSGLDALAMPDVISFRAVFDLSYDHLPESLATAFRCLALHPGKSISAASAAAMTGTELPDARRTLAELSRRNLMARTSGERFEFHNLAHLYAREKVRGDPSAHRSASMRALLNHQLHAANRADRLINTHRRPVELEPCARLDLVPDLVDSAAAVAWFSAEYDDVLAAAQTAATADEHPYTWQLPWVLSNFASLTTRWQDWIDTHVGAVAAARQLGNRVVEARLLQSLARAQSESGALADSALNYRAALDIMTAADDTAGRANALNGLSGVLLRSGAHSRARERAWSALALYLSIADESGTASTHGLLGRLSHAAGRPGESLRHHRLAHHSYLQSGNLYGLAHTADCLAEVETAAGNHKAAADHLRTAAELHHQVGSAHRAIRSCNNLLALLRSDPRAPATTARIDRAVTRLKDRSPLSVTELVELITADTCG